jgi:hypothetical protein
MTSTAIFRQIPILCRKSRRAVPPYVVERFRGAAVGRAPRHRSGVRQESAAAL